MALTGDIFSLDVDGTWLSPRPVASSRTPGVQWLRGHHQKMITGIVLATADDSETQMSYVFLPDLGYGWLPSAFFYAIAT